MLLVASYVFYSAWDWRFLSLIIFSTVVDYFVGLAMDREADEARRKRLLFVSLATNLGLLAIFKYFNFFAASFIDLANLFGWSPGPMTVNIILPVGISFYTFQTLSYTIDIYRREFTPTRRFFDFALFVAFFPQLVAGPIERAKNLLPNVLEPRRLCADNFGRGVILCLIGLIKKMVIADSVAGAVDSVYGAPDPGAGAIYIGTLLFAVQIYCDFSGYTDIARGIAKMLGFELMRNFAQPYFSTSPSSFWRRWHISLSSWLRNYLYISLGGNRGGDGKTYRNLMLTMLLGGLWHGAAWNFVAWGAYHGAMLIVYRMVGGFYSPSWRSTWFGKALGVVVFFNLTLYGWLLFRAKSFSQIADYTEKLFSLHSWVSGVNVLNMPALASFIGMAFVLSWDIVIERTGNHRFYERLPMIMRAGLYAGMFYLLAFGATGTTNAFIYFQF